MRTRHSLVDGDPQHLQVEPLGDVMRVEAQEEGEDEDDDHRPELATSPLRHSELRQELAPDVLKLIMTTGGRVALVTQGLSARHGWHGVIIRRNWRRMY